MVQCHGDTVDDHGLTLRYSASAADYVGIDQTYKIRYERALYFAG